MLPTKAATAVTVVKNMGTVGSQLWNVVRQQGTGGTSCDGGSVWWTSCGDILPMAQSTSLAALSPACTAPSMYPKMISNSIQKSCELLLNVKSFWTLKLIIIILLILVNIQVTGKRLDHRCIQRLFVDRNKYCIVCILWKYNLLPNWQQTCVFKDISSSGVW